MPKEAIEGTYIDTKRPFTGNIFNRNLILSDAVTKMRMQRTVICWHYIYYMESAISLKSTTRTRLFTCRPCPLSSSPLPPPRLRDVQIETLVTLGECKPLSKTVCFHVFKVTKAAGPKKQFQKF
ncbi:40S ribosomal protein S11 [Cricetulus griseus]|uniref:40S ribosomal protein S11 n=1 Tax=Cricetulus griseus TaxID=10029 RepID=G3I7R8_CRIGR|nr:40S ribosomal protein S11 [Cricetulus griseus]